MSWDHFRDVLPVLTLLVGYFGTTLTERARDRRGQRQRLIDSATELQRSTMLALQDALAAHFVLVARFATERGRSADPDAPELDDRREAEHAARIGLLVLANRVLDDQAREMVHAYSEKTLALVRESRPKEDRNQVANAELRQAIERLGELLRGSDPSR